jgi:ActR/RegA family two-component response regulator
MDQEAETSRRLNMHRRTLQRILSRNANFKFNGAVQD